ncbi:ATP-binding protein [Streptomyces sp. NPDC085946]|uniref:ATP-binding protein n=1 Tax=Streptomyces sp. NPDC085946 TaxID=3365744 RepID=UPI0037D65ACE
MLFRMVTKCEEKNSIAIASNKAFTGWSKAFTDPRLCAVIVGRLTLNATLFEAGAGFCRLTCTKARRDKSGTPATMPRVFGKTRTARKVSPAKLPAMHSPLIICPPPRS